MPVPKTLAADLEPVAKDTLAAFDIIAQAAKAELNFISGEQRMSLRIPATQLHIASPCLETPG